MRGRLLVAVAAAGAVVLASPFVGEIRAVVERAFPGQYLAILLTVVLLPAVLVIAAALVRIRDHRIARYGLLVAAGVIAVLYATVMQTTRTEQFHFTEYGLLAFLFYRAWRWRGGAASLVLPVCAASITGFADEWFQWFVPSRVGEGRDVVLNLVGVTCGLLVATAMNPPVRVAFVESRSRRALGVGVAATIVAGAAFMHTVHLGYEVRDIEVGMFLSRFDAGRLREIMADRATRWRRQPPPQTMPLIAREDHYLSEGIFHVQWRNLAASSGDMQTAWKENLILEKFYAAVLESGSPGSQWPPEQRAAMAAAATSATEPYVSQAYPFPIYAWNRLLFWGASMSLVAVVLALCR